MISPTLLAEHFNVGDLNAIYYEWHRENWQTVEHEWFNTSVIIRSRLMERGKTTIKDEIELDDARYACPDHAFIPFLIDKLKEEITAFNKAAEIYSDFLGDTNV